MLCRRPRFDTWVRKIRRRRVGYPLQYSWASLVAQLVKNPPTMQEAWVWTLGWEDPLEKEKATHSSIHGLWTSQMGPQRVGHDWVTFTFSTTIFILTLLCSLSTIHAQFLSIKFLFLNIKKYCICGPVVKDSELLVEWVWVWSHVPSDTAKKYKTKIMKPNNKKQTNKKWKQSQ